MNRLLFPSDKNNQSERFLRNFPDSRRLQNHHNLPYIPESHPDTKVSDLPP